MCKTAEPIEMLFGMLSLVGPSRPGNTYYMQIQALLGLGMEVGLVPGNFVFDGDPATPRKKGTPTPTQFLAHVYCGQTTG